MRVFVGKHPCDDLPYINGTDPDPRTGDERFTFDGPDYSGWYVRETDLPSMLAGVSELAARYGVQPNTVAVWTQRHKDFPEPLLQVGGRVRVWWAPDVDKWVEAR